MGNESSTEGTWNCPNPHCQRNRDDTTSLQGLLIGKSGAGKSSTGNFLLGKRQFSTSGGSKFETTKVKVGWTHHCCYRIKVVDGPDLTKANLLITDGTDNVWTEMDKTLFLCNGGVDLFLLVIKFGDRFTPEMKETISDLKQIFGEDYLKERGIIVVTGGDLFETSKKKDGTPDLTFMDWVSSQEQDGDFKKLVKECSSRIVLFHNFLEGKEERTAQICNLLKCVKELKNKGLYTSDHFERSKKTRQELINRTKLPLLKEQFQWKIGIIIEEVEKLSSQNLHLEDDFQTSPPRDLSQNSPSKDKFKNSPLEDDSKSPISSLESKIIDLLSDIKNEEWKEKLTPLNDVLKKLHKTVKILKSATQTAELLIQELRDDVDMRENLKKCAEISWEEIQSMELSMSSALLAMASNICKVEKDHTRRESQDKKGQLIKKQKKT